MKKILVFFIFIILTARISSQTIVATTWYVIPPTSGCNGIWAIDASAWPCFTAGCAYSAASPFGCLSTTFPTCDSIVADTLYLPLCSMPCDIAASCGPGPVVICGTPPPMTTGISNNNLNEIMSSINSEGNLTIENLKPDDEIELYDITGRKMLSGKSGDSKKDISLSNLSHQIYLLIVKRPETGYVYRNKITICK